MSISDQVRQLEELLSKLRMSGAFLLDQDTWDRFGRAHASDQEIDERMTREREMIALRDASMKALAEHTQPPEAVSVWADAHITLLDHFIATTVVEAGPNAVAVGVAKQERESWQAVKRGDQRYVDGNSFFIQFDRELYRDLFGMER